MGKVCMELSDNSSAGVIQMQECTTTYGLQVSPSPPKGGRFKPLNLAQAVSIRQL